MPPDLKRINPNWPGTSGREWLYVIGAVGLIILAIGLGG